MFQYDSEEIKRIKKIYNELPRKKEANIRNTVVREFLAFLGYDPFTFDYEHPTFSRSGYTDIAIPIDNEIKLYVECKEGDHKLQQKEIVQLLKDLSTTSIEWGILTNGREYILFNNDIKTLPGPKVGVQSTLEDKIIFRFDIFSNSQKTRDYLPFLSKEHIFENNVTYYYKYIAQFKAYKHPNDKGHGSWVNYRSTLYNFFLDYSYQAKKFREIENIRAEEFQKYLEKHNMYTTNANKWTHMRVFMNLLEDNKLIGKHDFKGGRKEQLTYVNEENRVEVGELNKDNIEIILDDIEFRKDSLKNKTLLLFIIYLGPNVPMLQDLRSTSFNFEKEHFELLERKIPLPPKLAHYAKELIKENKKKKYRENSLFIYSKNGRTTVVDEGNTSYLVSTIAKKHSSVKGLTLRSIRKQLVGILFKNNYNIEEISFLMNMSLENIGQNIKQEDIDNRVNLFRKNTPKKEHPFKEYLE